MNGEIVAGMIYRYVKYARYWPLLNIWLKSHSIISIGLVNPGERYAISVFLPKRKIVYLYCHQTAKIIAVDKEPCDIPVAQLMETLAVIRYFDQAEEFLASKGMHMLEFLELSSKTFNIKMLSQLNMIKEKSRCERAYVTQFTLDYRYRDYTDVFQNASDRQTNAIKAIDGIGKKILAIMEIMRILPLPIKWELEKHLLMSYRNKIEKH